MMPAGESPPPSGAAPRKHWLRRVTSFLLIIFCFELGAFLLVAPWWGTFWDNNFFGSLVGSRIWSNSYFRGAVSGVGVVNLLIALAEAYGFKK